MGLASSRWDECQSQRVSGYWNAPRFFFGCSLVSLVEDANFFSWYGHHNIRSNDYAATTTAAAKVEAATVEVFYDEQQGLDGQAGGLGIWGSFEGWDFSSWCSWEEVEVVFCRCEGDDGC